MPSNVIGTYDLIGHGRIGRDRRRGGGDIVLSSLAELGLAPLGELRRDDVDFALLPGCPAIDAGSSNLIPGGLLHRSARRAAGRGRPRSTSARSSARDSP